MVDKVKSCYASVTANIWDFQNKIVELCNAGKLDPHESAGLQTRLPQFVGTFRGTAKRMCW
jgi:hypothetical protein